MLAVPAEGAAQDSLVMHHELVLRLVAQVLAQSARVEVPNLPLSLLFPALAMAMLSWCCQRSDTAHREMLVLLPLVLWARAQQQRYKQRL